MARVFAAVSLSDCNLRTQETTTLYTGPDAFDAFQSVFRQVVAGPPHHSENEGRAKKRRKLLNGQHANVQEPFDPSKSAVLAAVTLDLVSGCPSFTTPRCRSSTCASGRPRLPSTFNRLWQLSARQKYLC